MVTKTLAIDLEEIRAQLRKAKDDERPNRAPSLREAVKSLLPEIEGLRKARWSDAQISEWLGKRGMEISPGTLAQYLREARKHAAESSTEHKPRKNAKGSDEPAKAVTDTAPEGQTDIESFIGKKEPAAKSTTETKKPAEQKTEFVPNVSAATTTKRRVNDDA